MISSPTADVPHISVVTVVFNGAMHLEHCLQTVRNQAGISLEHIVIDGASRDASVEIIRRHADGLFYWISEPDRGISDAMNKGLAQARGDWILFLQSDDFLLSSDSLRLCYQVLADTHADVVCFPVEFGIPGKSRLLKPRGGGLWLNLKNGLPHQACFTRRSLFHEVGDFDLGLTVNMDYEFFLRAKRAGARFETRNSPVPSFMRDAGVSSQRDWKSLRRRFDDERRIHFRHADNVALRLFYRAYWPVYLAYRRLRSLSAKSLEN
jgi:glycosyltransferase involved in cell wall biosynthesis